MTREIAGRTATDDGEKPIDQALFGLLRYEEVLGAVAISAEGLVLGSAGISPPDAEMVGALGASLVGAADRSTRRLGAGEVREVSLGMDGGMLHVRNGGEFAVLLFTERCDPAAAGEICAEAARSIASTLT